MSNNPQGTIKIILPEIKKTERASIHPDSDSSAASHQKHHRDGLYEIKPNFISRKIDDRELFEDNSHRMNVLEQINEDLIDEYEETSPQKEQVDTSQIREEPINIFKSEKLTAIKYKELSKGPVILNGHVVKHSVCGPVELFQSGQQKARKAGQKDSMISGEKESSENSVGKNQRPVSNSKSIEPSVSFNAVGHGIGQKKVNERKRDPKREVQITREDFFNQIDKLKETEEKFYKNQDDRIKNLQKGDFLYLTREQRCLDKFSMAQADWDRIVHRNNMKIGREPERSVTAGIEQFRQKRELVNVFEAIKTDNEKYGSMVWYTTLRKTTPNMGLVKKIDDYPDAFDQTEFQKNKARFEVITRPGTHHGGLSFSKSHTKFFGRSGREYVEEKYRQKPKALQELHPADYNDVQELAVVGKNQLAVEVDRFMMINDAKDKVRVPKKFVIREYEDKLENIVVHNFEKKEILRNGLAVCLK